MSADRRRDKENVMKMHTMVYYSPFKKKEILHYVDNWMNLEDTMLKEVSQSQKMTNTA